VTAPTLLVWGEHDPIVPRANAHRNAELIADTRLELEPATAHSPLLERPEATVDLILDFLGG
jgi:pimeloyl-ACP methyl ester carboxylesterase